MHHREPCIYLCGTQTMNVACLIHISIYFLYLVNGMMKDDIKKTVELITPENVIRKRLRKQQSEIDCEGPAKEETNEGCSSVAMVI